MSWKGVEEGLLLQRSYLFGITGIVLCLLALVNSTYGWFAAPMGPLNGAGIFLQLFGLSVAVMVLRKRSIKEKTKDKAKKMVLVLAVSLIYFFMMI
jgi:positive regulator of sigma E activity